MSIRCLSLLCAALVGVSGLCSRTLSSQMQLAGTRDRSAVGEGAVRAAELPSPPQSAGEQRIVVSLHDVPLKTALREIARKSSVDIVYNDADVPAARLVSIEAGDVTVIEALRIVLRGTGLTARAGNPGISIEKTGGRMSHPSHVDSTGSISGHVTDSTTGSAVQGARVTLERSNASAIAADDGGFRMAEVAPGSYVVTARRLGYLPASHRITVSAGSETVVEIRLVPAPRTLDQVVTTGTVVPTDVKKLPNPISIMNESDIAAQHPRTLGELLREFVPGMVAWDQGNYPQNTSFAVRGAASISGSSMKVYLDGVELADRTSAAIDPNSIERIEVLRGPQAATIYGSDAIGGVIQIFTKRGDTTANQPRVELRSALGTVQTAYEGFGATLRQEYSASIRGASPTYSYNLGGSYTHLGDWIPEGHRSLPSVYGGIRVEQGSVTIDLSGRSNNQELQQNSSPVGAATGYPLYSKPFHTDVSSKEQSIGSRVTWRAATWFRHDLTIGIDRFQSRSQQRAPRFVSPSDTLLRFAESGRSKTFMAYSASLSGVIASDVEATITGGVDHYDLQSSSYSTSGATNVRGSVITDPLRPIVGSRDNVTNTGVFAQFTGTFRSRLTLTGGLRAEHNSAVGSNVKTPVSPRVGLAYATDVGDASVKLRTSYGEALLPPTPLQTQRLDLGGGSFLLANPDLKPERQRGWDAGADVEFGSRGSLSVTYYDQTARDLIEFVVVTQPFLEYQFQNVGRIRNRGAEFDGTLRMGTALLRAQFAITNSRVGDLGPAYTGDLRVGGHPLMVPRYTGGASIAFAPWSSASLTAGLKYVGPFRNYDSFAQLSCAAGNGGCQPTSRDYIVDYHGFAKVDIALTQRLNSWSSGFISVRNAGNNTAPEQNNVNVAIMGRITMAGVQVTF